ncbi:TIM44-like domain-containing protein [Arenibaculum pallidiluteum]|uniref:TIM44-like domain-containing protein n=1 Tax=Arenibaculum pallidiluteum TaxID=2812559 RepID=UPI001A962C96|nr:TIM44-like domain-containing protein [Arenibaculum pallidiluteum]
MKQTLRSRRFVAFAAALAILAAPVAAEARAGKGGSVGSRGARTYSAPPATNTAPGVANPMERSATPAPGVQRPAAPMGAPAARPGLLSGRGGFFGGLMGGLLGAGLIGMLLGNGFLGGMAGFASILGLLLQVLLVVFLARLAFRWFQRRQQPALAGAGGPMRRESTDWPQRPAGSAGGGLGGYGAAPAAAAYGAQRAERRDDVGIVQDDYAAFERILTGVQEAYGREDVQGLRMLATPEMTGYFAEEIEQNAQRGVVNRISGVRLLQGDLAESWRENGAEYATVALRFALRDWTLDRASGRVVDGDADRDTEATEVWTFRRVPRGPWLLAAIQQA